MNMSQLENNVVEKLKNATAVLSRARRKYSSAVARIRRVEKFLEKHIAGLGYDSEYLYGEIEPFKCPPEPVIIGLSRHPTRSYVIFFAKRDGDWHLYVAPTRNTNEGTLILNEEASPLISARADVVLCCVDTIESYASEILEHLAIVVAVSSGDEAALAQSEATEGKKVAQDPPKKTVH